MNVTRRSNAARILIRAYMRGRRPRHDGRTGAAYPPGMTKPEARKEEICITIR